MIVKNEEKNIEKALGWAKPVAYEQIVVDTGSTDKTVELAEKMGAKVYHFEWIDDFGAAKNFAIEQATGNWIAFLDADEYLSPEDAQKLLKKLKQIEAEPKTGKSISVIRTPWVQLNDKNEVFAIYKQSRIFRNLPQLRYKGKIHEALLGHGEIIFTDDISIMHTGYAIGAFEETSKLERNIKLLRAGLKENPNDIMLKAYLADSINNKVMVENPNSNGADPEADILFDEVLKSSESINTVMKKKAYVYFIVKYLSDPEKYTECENLCLEAAKQFSNDLDFEYFRAVTYSRKGKFKEAYRMLKELEITIANTKDTGDTIFVTGDSTLIDKQLLVAAQGMGDVEAVIQHASVVLNIDKTNQSILSPYIYTLINHGVSEEEVVGHLGKIYNLGNPSDLLFIARAAKDCGAVEFARVIMIIAGEMLN